MKIVILSCGKVSEANRTEINSAAFDELYRLTVEGDIEPAAAKHIAAEGRRIYIGCGKAARQTAEQFIDGESVTEQALLNEVPQRAYRDSETALPLRHWQRMAALQRYLGNRRQPESRAQALARADELISRLEAGGQDCILVSYPIFLKYLLERLKAHGYCVARSEIFSIKPLERILVTRRDMHCGGCSHNCLLTNPGCGVGRDKAQRHSG